MRPIPATSPRRNLGAADVRLQHSANHVPTGHQLKAEGQQFALEFSGPWKDQVVDLFKAWAEATKPTALRQRFTIEQFRASLTPAQQPLSHKAWGALPRVLVRLELIAPVLHDDGSPVFMPAASAATHSHPIRVWEFR